MKCYNFLPSALLALLSVASFLSPTEAARQPANSVLLRNVQSLTLRKGVKTSHRRVSALPQLKCVGGDAKGLYEVDVMRCTNSGSAYDDDNIEWTCKASLPPEFKLGSTDVICEGYSHPDDPYVLKGSCGVEYRLVLTEQGEQKYGKKSSAWWGKEDSDSYGPTKVDKFVSSIFWLLFVGVALWMAYSFLKNYFANNNRTGNPPRRPGGGFGGGGWGGGDDNDPPPPYDWRPSRKPSTQTNPSGQEGWRPGFWSGALGGAAAGYMMGNRGGQQNQGQTRSWGTPPGRAGGGGWFGGGNAGEGPSGTRGGRSDSDAPSTARYESTGFGSTRRR